MTTLAAMVIAIAIVPAFFSITTTAQGRQLSLADILIALRSKKAPLSDRNKLLAEAVSDRGTTFNLTPEIEKELAVTGADKGLINSIRKAARKEMVIVPAADTRSANNVEPPRSELPDTASLESRASDSVKKGDLDAAIIDYTKVIELDASSVSSLLGRGGAYLARNLYTLAIADLTKAIELDPSNAPAYSLRGQAHEKRSEKELAIEDFKKAFQLDPANEIAKAQVEKWNAEQARSAVQIDPAPVISPEPVVLPEFVDLGQLTDAQTIKLVKPVYSQVALNARISGRVVVEVDLDKEGNVTRAKTVKGHPYLRKSSEDAARDSKFKPAMIGGVAVKAKGTVVYSYVPHGSR
jgi:TonB family protein